MVKPDDFDIGAALNALIARSGKEKKALAAHMGVSEQAVQKWIKEGKIARDNVREICLFLGCSADELLGLIPIRDDATAPASQSQLVRLDPVMLSETHAALSNLERKQGRKFSLEESDYAAQFVQLYCLRAGMSAQPTTEEWVAYVRKLDAITAPQGALDGRTDGVPAHGGGTKKVARKVHR